MEFQRKILNLGLIIAIALFAVSCGSDNDINGFWRGAEYRADVRSVEVISGAYGIASGVNYVQGVAPGQYSMEIQISLAPYYGFYYDSVYIMVADVTAIQPGQYYPLGTYNGIVAKMSIDGSPLSPEGNVRFTKLSLYQSKTVCGEYDFYVADGTVGEFHGSFCGDVSVGYQY